MGGRKTFSTAAKALPLQLKDLLGHEELFGEASPTADHGHISVQFLAEALILSFLGGVAGCLIGGGVTWGMCIAYGWPPTLHWWVIAAGLGATVLIGAIAGLYPAIRAARTPPTAALASQ